MTASLTHRGPDDHGCYFDGPIGLGHTRLSIIDLQGSKQPLVTSDGGIVAVFNGELYNFRELRSNLAARGHVFRTQGDGEVLLHGWREHGKGMLESLTGMFAFALWDRSRRELFLARDQFGVKPLYYAWYQGSLVFGSEIKALLHFPGIPRTINLDALALYLECQYIPAPNSIYRSVHKLTAGHWLSIRDGKLFTGSFSKQTYVPKRQLGVNEAVDEFDARLTRSVKSMLVADVPVGVFLSGGVDSGLVAAIANDASGGPIDTFNVGFTGGGVVSEHEHAARVARHIGTHHHCLMLTPRDVLPMIDKWLDVFDEPFGDHAALPTMVLAKFARETVKVVLTGEGADEVWGGYDNYDKRVREERYTSILSARWSPVPAMLRMLPERILRDRILKAATLPLAQRYTTIPNVFDSMLRKTYLSRAFRHATQAGMADFAEAAYRECDSPAYLDKLLHIDVRLWLADDLLLKVDRATMAYSLEARVPYLDQPLVDWCAHLEPTMKVGGRVAKFLLKRLAEKYLPRDIVYRSKQGFTMPLDRWLVGDLRDEVQEALGPRGMRRRGLMQVGVIERMLSEHMTAKKNHATRLWSLLMLERWFARHAPDFAI